MQNDQDKGSLTDKFRDFGAKPSDGLWESIAGGLDADPATAARPKRVPGPKLLWAMGGFTAASVIAAGLWLSAGKEQPSVATDAAPVKEQTQITHHPIADSQNNNSTTAHNSENASETTDRSSENNRKADHLSTAAQEHSSQSSGQLFSNGKTYGKNYPAKLESSQSSRNKIRGQQPGQESKSRLNNNGLNTSGANNSLTDNRTPVDHDHSISNDENHSANHSNDQNIPNNSGNHTSDNSSGNNTTNQNDPVNNPGNNDQTADNSNENQTNDQNNQSNNSTGDNSLQTDNRTSGDSDRLSLEDALERWLKTHPRNNVQAYINPTYKEPKWMLDAHYGRAIPVYANYDYTQGSSYAALDISSGFNSPPAPQTRGYSYKYQTIELNISRRFGKRIWVESGLKLGIFNGLRKQDLVHYDYVPEHVKTYSLGVPVSMRFLFIKKRKWDIYVRAGVLNVAGFRSSYDYYKNSYYGDWTLYNSPVQTQFNYELSAHGNIGFERQIYKNLTFDFRLEVRYYVPLSFGNQDMRDRWVPGASTGLAWKF